MNDPNILDTPEEKVKHSYNFILQLLLSFSVYFLGSTLLLFFGKKWSFLDTPIDLYFMTIKPMGIALILVITTSIAIIVGTSRPTHKF